MLIYAFDRQALGRCAGAHLVAGPVKKLGVVLDADVSSDMEHVSCFAGSVVPIDGGSWRMYYSCTQRRPLAFGIAVAESGDGIHWTKPRLGQMLWEGNDTNRLVMEDLHDTANIVQPVVLQLPDGRWRMYFWYHRHDQGMIRYLIAESEDGLQFRTVGIDRPAILHPADREVGQHGKTAGLTAASDREPADANRSFDPMQAKRLRSNDATYVYYDDAKNEFEMYSVWLLPNGPETHRHVPHDNAPSALRTIHRRVSDDGLSWSAPELVMVPDADDPLDMQFYYLAVHRQSDWRIGFLGHYRCWAQTMDIELCFSRDGRHWDRPLRGGWVPRDPPPQRGCMSAYATNDLIDLGDRWLMLYTAGNMKHNDELPEGVKRRWSGVMGATVPKCRLAGLASSPRTTARLALSPFILTESEVRLDADVNGELRAELCDPFGTPLPGFEMDRSIPIHGDRPDHVLRWEGSKTASPYRYDAVSLRVEMTDATLYAVRV